MNETAFGTTIPEHVSRRHMPDPASIGLAPAPVTGLTPTT
jgi:hypothetical protein